LHLALRELEPCNSVRFHRLVSKTVVLDIETELDNLINNRHAKMELREGSADGERFLKPVDPEVYSKGT
jgi:hypothetical protein